MKIEHTLTFTTAALPPRILENSLLGPAVCWESCCSQPARSTPGGKCWKRWESVEFAHGTSGIIPALATGDGSSAPQQHHGCRHSLISSLIAFWELFGAAEHSQPLEMLMDTFEYVVLLTAHSRRV